MNFYLQFQGLAKCDNSFKVEPLYCFATCSCNPNDFAGCPIDSCQYHKKLDDERRDQWIKDFLIKNPEYEIIEYD